MTANRKWKWNASDMQYAFTSASVNEPFALYKWMRKSDHSASSERTPSPMPISANTSSDHKIARGQTNRHSKRPREDDLRVGDVYVNLVQIGFSSSRAERIPLLWVVPSFATVGKVQKWTRAWGRDRESWDHWRRRDDLLIRKLGLIKAGEGHQKSHCVQLRERGVSFPDPFGELSSCALEDRKLCQVDRTLARWKTAKASQYLILLL